MSDDKNGHLELIIGPMFSGKTSKLIEIYNFLMETFFVSKVSIVLRLLNVFSRSLTIGNQRKNTYQNRRAFHAIWHKKHYNG